MTQKFLTKANEKALPALYAQDGKGYDATAHVKFFTPWAGWTWFATEYDPDTGTFFGWATDGSGTGELGYFTKAELTGITGPVGLTVERDYHFTATTLTDAIANG